MKKVTFEGWKNCIELNSGDFKPMVTALNSPYNKPVSYSDPAFWPKPIAADYADDLLLQALYHR